MQSDSVDVHDFVLSTRRELFHSFLKIFNVLEKRVHLIKTKIKAKCLFRPFNSFTNYLTSKQ